jgi:hypothetical protein
MIVLLPVIMLMFRALVIRQRVVQLTSADQKLLYVSSAFSCFIAVALSVPFAGAARARQSAQPFESDTAPQGIVLALLVLQLCPTLKSDLFIGLRHSALKASVSAAASAGGGSAAAAAVPQRRRRVIQHSREVE